MIAYANRSLQVEIQVDLDELEEVGENLETVFDLEDDPFDAEVVDIRETADEDPDEDAEEEHFSDVSSEDEPDPEDEPDFKEAPRDPTHVKDMASKLDAILKLVLDHLHTSHSADPPLPLPSFLHNPPTSTSSSPSASHLPDLEKAEKLFEIQHTQFRTLLFTFERTILRTFKSRYTQFLLFWFTSLNADFADEFLGTLIHRVITVSEPPTTRAAAASYLASFVSRARFVDGENVRRVMRLLCAYLGRELEMYAEQKEAVHISHFAPFYSVSQAVFLMFCFRWRDLQQQPVEESQAEEEEANDELGLNAATANPARAGWIAELDIMQQVIVSPLNPLKVSTLHAFKLGGNSN